MGDDHRLDAASAEGGALRLGFLDEGGGHDDRGGDAALRAAFDRVDYLEWRDAATLAPLAAAERPGRLLAAVRLGPVRLIDNLAVGGGRP